MIRHRNPHMTIPDFGFPISRPVEGFPIPGVAVPLPRTKVVTYPDGSDHELVKHRRMDIANPIVSYGSMDEQHGKGSVIARLLEAMAKGVKDPEKIEEMRTKPLAVRQPAAHAQGYEKFHEDRSWRLP